MELEIDSLPTVQQREEGKADAINKRMPSLCATIYERYQEAKDHKDHFENIWLKSWYDFKGEYNSETQFRSTEKSRIFVKIPKTKTLAAYSQILEIIFAPNKFPISIRPTEVPEGAPEYATLQTGQDNMAKPADVGYAGDEKENEQSPQSGGLSSMFHKYFGAKFTPGRTNPKAPTIKPAEEAAMNMEKVIHDQITENDTAKEIRKAVFEMCLYGSGVLKGPTNFNKLQHTWIVKQNGKSFQKTYEGKEKVFPLLEYISAWDLFPDPAALTIEEADFIIQRHKLSVRDLRKLSDQPLFNRNAIIELLRRGPNYTLEDYEYILHQSTNNVNSETNRWEVLEYWGVMDRKFALEAGIELPEQYDELTQFTINAWVSGDVIMKISINPLEPERLPYFLFPYEENPHEMWGIGVPEKMSTSTQVMNGHARMAIDNLAYSGSVIFDIDESALVPGQPMTIFPGKIFRRHAGSATAAINVVRFPNTTQENLMMFDKFRQLADEETSIPSYSHGATGVQSMTRTASGMSMLMGASVLSIKTVIKNLDDFLLKPLGESLFHWNMQFNDDVTIRGDIEVKALGTTSLMMKEVRSQRLMQFLQIVAGSPATAPFGKIHKIIKDIAIELDLNGDDYINDPEEAAIFAQIMSTMGGAGGSAGAGGAMSMPGARESSGSSGSGGGNMGVGSTPMPNEAGFSGSIPGGGQ
jgi:hypothetical protein